MLHWRDIDSVLAGIVSLHMDVFWLLNVVKCGICHDSKRGERDGQLMNLKEHEKFDIKSCKLVMPNS